MKFNPRSTTALTFALALTPTAAANVSYCLLPLTAAECRAIATPLLPVLASFNSDSDACDFQTAARALLTVLKTCNMALPGTPSVEDAYNAAMARFAVCEYGASLGFASPCDPGVTPAPAPVPEPAPGVLTLDTCSTSAPATFADCVDVCVRAEVAGARGELGCAPGGDAYCDTAACATCAVQYPDLSFVVSWDLYKHYMSCSAESSETAASSVESTSASTASSFEPSSATAESAESLREAATTLAATTSAAGNYTVLPTTDTTGTGVDQVNAAHLSAVPALAAMLVPLAAALL